jgi:choline-sulfatase
MNRTVVCALSLGLAMLGPACSKNSPTAAPGATAVATASDSAAASSASSTTVASPVPSARAASSGPPKDANVILLSIDSLRADMPWAGYSRPIAPRLTELEKRAVYYTHAYSTSSYTSMSLGGMLAGRIPSELNRSGYFFSTYKDDPFWAKLLQTAKVHTMGVHAHAYFGHAGWNAGFDQWEIVPGIKFDNTTDRSITSQQSEEISERLLGDAALDSTRFFFWAHFLDPHDLYQAHEGIGPYGKTDRDKYDAEVTFTDRYIGKLVDFIATKSWAKRTVIIVTADHGEAFGEHGMTRHGFEVWEPLIHVPLFVIAPGATPKHIDTPRSALDLAPTIFDFIGVTPDPGFEGKSDKAEIYGAAADPRDVWVDLPMTSDNDFRRALIRGTDKLICFHNDDICKLFDLAADPGEDHPITTGEKFTTMLAAFKENEKTLKPIAPYGCKAGCLNKGYLNK